MIDDPFIQRAKEIDEILAQIDSFTVVRLMQSYESSGDKTAFVAALIGRLMMAEARRSVTNPQDRDIP